MIININRYQLNKSYSIQFVENLLNITDDIIAMHTKLWEIRQYFPQNKFLWNYIRYSGVMKPIQLYFPNQINISKISIHHNNSARVLLLMRNRTEMKH